MILIAKDIKKKYCTKTESISVLNGINMELNNSDFASIMGPSGAGKSTLLHIFGTIDPFDSGNLEINFNKITKDKDYSKFRSKNIGFVFQFHHLLHEFTILENLIIPQMLVDTRKNNAENNAIELLKRLELINLKNRYPNEISGGERQRVSVLRAMVNLPKLILADEPTGNLDKENSIKLLKLFKTIKNDFNTSILVATHDELIKEFTNRNFNLDNGILTEN